MSPTNAAFSACSFIAFFLILIPLPWHLEAWNTGTCLYIVWTAIGLLSYFINSIVWSDNAINYAPVWCDISARLIVGISIAIPAASLCINHRLYRIAAVRTVTRTKAEKVRGIMVDLAIGIGLPFLVMILQYIVQGHRFDIYEEIGCYPFTYNTPPAYFLVWMIPIPIGLTSGYFCVMSVLAFRKRQAEFKEMLSSNSNLSSHRFFRLMALAGVEVLCCIPLATTGIILNATEGRVRPWISWEDTHWGFSRVDQIPAVLWKADPSAKIGLEMTRWLLVVCALVFFAFFGFADEAQKHYKLALNSVVKRVGYTTFSGSTKIGTSHTSSTGFKGASSNGTASQGGGIPVFIRQEVTKKRDSLDSMSDLTSLKDSEFASEINSPTTSPYNTLSEKNGNSLRPPIFTSDAESGITVVDGPTPALSPAASFLDLSSKEGPVPGNDEKV